MNYIKDVAMRIMSCGVEERCEKFIAAVKGCYELGINPLPRLREQGVPCKFVAGDGANNVDLEFASVHYSCISTMLESFAMKVEGGWVIFGDLAEIRARLERANEAMYAARQLRRSLIERKGYCEYTIQEMKTAAITAAWRG